MRDLTVFSILVLLCGCRDVVTHTTIINTMRFPNEADETNSDDIDGDGEVRANDNSFAGIGINQLFVSAGLDFNALLGAAVEQGSVAVGLRVSAKNFEQDKKNTALEGFLADLGGVPPSFDGADNVSALRPDGGPFPFTNVLISGGSLFSDNTNSFQFPLVFDPANPAFIALHNARIGGRVSEDGTLHDAKLTGFITAQEFAVAFPTISGLARLIVEQDATDPSFNPSGVAVPCAALLDCTNAGLPNAFCTDEDADPAATGFCVAADSRSGEIFSAGINGNSELNIDADNDGICEISFNGTSFDQNELPFLFDFDANDLDGDGFVVGGVLGVVLFRLDLESSIPNNDSAGVGITFTSVPAVE